MSARYGWHRSDGPATWQSCVEVSCELLAHSQPTETAAVGVMARLDTGTPEEAHAFRARCQRLAKEHCLCATVWVSERTGHVRFCRCPPDRGAHEPRDCHTGGPIAETRRLPAATPAETAAWEPGIGGGDPLTGALGGLRWTDATQEAAGSTRALAPSRHAQTAISSEGERLPMYGDVLIVEDEPTFRRTIARNLTGRGVRVREAGTANEAVRAAVDQLPDLLLLDLNLPDRSGWDVLRELRRRGLDVPTIVVSAVRVRPERLREFRPLAHLPKPFPLEALLHLVLGSDGRPDARTDASPARRGGA